MHKAHPKATSAPVASRWLLERDQDEDIMSKA